MLAFAVVVVHCLCCSDVLLFSCCFFFHFSLLPGLFGFFFCLIEQRYNLLPLYASGLELPTSWTLKYRSWLVFCYWRFVYRQILWAKNRYMTKKCGYIDLYIFFHNNKYIIETSKIVSVIFISSYSIILSFILNNCQILYQ